MTHTGSWQEIFLVRICYKGHFPSTTVIAALATITISTCHHDRSTTLVTGSPWLMLNARKWRCVLRTHFFTQWEKILTILKTILNCFLTTQIITISLAEFWMEVLLRIAESDVCGGVFSDLIAVIVLFFLFTFSHGIINMLRFLWWNSPSSDKIFLMLCDQNAK